MEINMYVCLSTLHVYMYVFASMMEFCLLEDRNFVTQHSALPTPHPSTALLGNEYWLVMKMFIIDILMKFFGNMRPMSTTFAKYGTLI